MTLLYSLKIVIISFLLLITNINPLNAQNKDFSDTKCNFPTGKYYKELSDLTSFQSIDVKVDNYKKWVKNPDIVPVLSVIKNLHNSVSTPDVFCMRLLMKTQNNKESSVSY